VRPALPQQSEAAPVESARDARPQLTANLSLADLDRVRQALQLLSEEPAAVSGRAAVRDDTPGPPALSTPGGDDEDTTPLPVVLPGAIAVPRPEVRETPRGPFEPARPSATVAVPAPPRAARPAPDGAAVLAPDDSAVPAEPEPADAEPAEDDDSLPPAAAEKLDQIKDLLITAEAIGEANLDRHFDRVSQRQRELIREFFDRAMPGSEPEA
jgi:hypothetical protein